MGTQLHPHMSMRMRTKRTVKMVSRTFMFDDWIEVLMLSMRDDIVLV